jgi:hypothetical protein
MRKVYLIGAILGAVIPYIFFGQFMLTHGLNLGLFLSQPFENPVAAGFAVDLIISSVVFWFFVFAEGRRLGMGYLWVYVGLNLLVGLSLALPLFLYMREGKLAQPRLEGSPT